MKCVAVFVLVLVTLCHNACGFYNEMAKNIQVCCNEGAEYAKEHPQHECSTSLPILADIPKELNVICSMTKSQCCQQYLNKKSDCDRGIESAMRSNHCGFTEAVDKVCCDDCLRGTTVGASKGPSACVQKPPGETAEESLGEEAFFTCCEKAAKDWKSDPSLSKLPSVCEDYAPNELCAHHCIPLPGSYKCECNPGFMLMADGRNCKKLTKNRCKPHNPCQHKCNDNGVEVKCTCRRGYELMSDGKSCKDIDECLMDVKVCREGSVCHNMEGSYRCVADAHVEKGQCPLGFTRNGNVCDDINECLLPNPPCPSYLCENTIGSYKCKQGISSLGPQEDSCPPGFRLGPNGICEDVDECANRLDNCNPLSQFCINSHGSYHCQDKVSRRCPPGFKIDLPTNKCEDINECEDESANCGVDQICINQLGQYDCKPKEKGLEPGQCPIGMRKNKDSCEDVNECTEGIYFCPPNQNCVNTNGSYECHCNVGYELDAGYCVDVNECATGQHSCVPQAQRCDNTVGSYLCVRIASCGTGYVLEHATGKCEDIDECALGIHNCGSDYSCFNLRGSFRCLRKRTSTTSTTTTPAPEYDDEYYYDSEDEAEPNNTSTSKQPELTTQSATTNPTTSKPETTSNTQPQSNRPEDNYIISPNETPPEPSTTEKLEPKSYVPTYSTSNRNVYTVDNQNLPDNYNTPPEYIPHEEQPKQFEQPKSETPIQPEPTNPQPDSEKPESTEPVFTVRPTSSYPIDVNIGKDTIIVPSEQKEDGSVVIYTKDVPENEWTNINFKPNNCAPGFEPDEYGSCFDIDECATNRHTCSGLTEECKNTQGGHLCICAPGFRRDLITRACDIITTSSTTTTTEPLPTLPSSTKKSYFWGYPEYKTVTSRSFRPRNLCDAGFHLNSMSGICEDINECKNGQANCAAVEICTNTEGGFRCDCPPNWRLDETKHRCVPLKNNGLFPPGYGNEPVYTPSVTKEMVPSQEATQYLEPEITQIEEGAIIKCKKGYRVGDDNTCIDINECITGEAKCGPQQSCTNLPGGYLCNCESGMRLVGDHECEDVDECTLAGNTHICSNNADCINTIGSYLCRCHTGFRSAPVNDKVCVDVDECMESRPGSLCQHTCNNVWGGYRCSCHRGYKLNADNRTCSDVDECIQYKFKMLCVGKCINEPGSYRCTCPLGYRLSDDKRNCVDIDECETGEAPCAKGGATATISDVCVNTRGSFKCHRITCPTGYQLENKHRCNKIEKVCQPGDWKCPQLPTTISYNFITFVSNLFIPDQRVPLFTMRGPNWPLVKMRFELKLVNVNAPPSVKRKADINDFLLTSNNTEGVTSLVRPLEGPQSIELEMTMELYTREQFGGTAIAKLFIYVSEYEF